MSNRSKNPGMAVWFPNWATALKRQDLPALHRQQHRRAIVEYLRFCKQARCRATVNSARQFMQHTEARRHLAVAQIAIWKQALNWFFAEAGKQPGVGADMPEDRSVRRMTTGTHAAPTIPALPTIAERDLGETPWEQRLIRELRTRHYQWRTEQTYRMWATRFARWLQQRHRTPQEATEEQIRDFLSDLATRQRCSAST